MTTFVALLRGINVGGAKRLAMADLRAAAERLGLCNVRTVLQSGNLLFETAALEEAALDRRLEAAIASDLGVGCDVVIRSAPDWRGMMAANPFGEAARSDPARLHLFALKSAPVADGEARLKAAIVGREAGRVIGRCAYIHYPDGMGDSKLTSPIIDRALGVRGTARNWNTVVKIAAIAGEGS